MNLLKDVPIHRIHQKITSKKANAGKSCELHQFTMDEIFEMIGDGVCQYSGREYTDLDNATFERINPRIGYVAGNVVMVCKEANDHKSALDAFIKRDVIPDAMKIKLLRKALYQLEKGMKDAIR